MDRFLFLVMFVLVLAIPAYAANVDGGVVDDGAAANSNPAVPLAEVDPADPEPAQEGSQAPAALAGSDLFAGGYWFVCDCVLGYDLTFYVPADWADGQLTLNSSGAPVNMSNNTVYAYCPDFPDYTFSAARFSTFTYRASNYNTVDLNVTSISDTNIDFLDDGSRRLSDYQLKVLSCALVFMVAVILIIKRG